MSTEKAEDIGLLPQVAVLPIYQAKEAPRCVGCQFTRGDYESSQAMRNLLAAEGCDTDCPILTGKPIDGSEA